MKFKYAVAVDIPDIELNKRKEKQMQHDIMNKIFDDVDGMMKWSGIKARITVTAVKK